MRRAGGSPSNSHKGCESTDGAGLFQGLKGKALRLEEENEKLRREKWHQGPEKVSEGVGEAKGAGQLVVVKR